MFLRLKNISKQRRVLFHLFILIFLTFMGIFSCSGGANNSSLNSAGPPSISSATGGGAIGPSDGSDLPGMPGGGASGPVAGNPLGGSAAAPQTPSAASDTAPGTGRCLRFEQKYYYVREHGLRAWEVYCNADENCRAMERGCKSDERCQDLPDDRDAAFQIHCVADRRCRELEERCSRIEYCQNLERECMAEIAQRDRWLREHSVNSDPSSDFSNIKPINSPFGSRKIPTSMNILNQTE